MNELATFAGAGGGLLASHLLGWRTVAAVEYDPHAASVLCARQNDGLLPPFPIWDDIRTFDGHPFRGRIDVLSGGFPCQAYSTAAAGKNNADDLWPEMRRVVADVAPRYVFAENVSRGAIDAACDDCEAMGYQACAIIALGAADLGADHVRERHWLLAYADDPRKLLRGLNAEMAGLPFLGHGVWASDPRGAGVANGVADRVDRIKRTGNGQVPIVAATALYLLANAA